MTTRWRERAMVTKLMGHRLEYIGDNKVEGESDGD